MKDAAYRVDCRPTGSVIAHPDDGRIGDVYCAVEVVLDRAAAADLAASRVGLRMSATRGPRRARRCFMTWPKQIAPKPADQGLASDS